MKLTARIPFGGLLFLPAMLAWNFHSDQVSDGQVDAVDVARSSEVIFFLVPDRLAPYRALMLSNQTAMA
jgi:hypothetical protein